MKILVSHPTTSQNLKAILSSLNQQGMLGGFTTTFAVNKDNRLLQLLPQKMKNELLRRAYQVPYSKIHTRPMLELCRILLPKIGFPSAAEHEKGFACLDKVYADLNNAAFSSLDKLTQEHAVDAVYCYEDGALEIFLKAKRMGLKCIYDLPITYWETTRRLANEEAERMPGWAPTLVGGINDSMAKLDRKNRELELADTIIVPGEFVKDSLPAHAYNKQIIISPFGSPAYSPVNRNYYKGNRPLRILFAGSMSQRKGLGDLFEAMKLLDKKRFELVVIGLKRAPMKFYKSEYEHFIYEECRPQHQVLELMANCDVLCLPSIIEGRALVMQEAMSQGLPIIITANTGGTDLIVPGETGFLIDIRSPEQIAEKLNWFAENPGECEIMGLKAKNHAASYTWEKYTEQIISELKIAYS
jgi:glycosyltransferase involved in cell wall biosynthesis